MDSWGMFPHRASRQTREYGVPPPQWGRTPISTSEGTGVLKVKKTIKQCLRKRGFSFGVCN